MKDIYRILDANFNRAREALRVCEDCGRFALNDPAITALAKNMRSEIADVLKDMPAGELVASRDTASDIGTEITSPTESRRESLQDVAVAATKRLTEALRTIEEYSKIVCPARTRKLERMRYDGYTLEQRLIGRVNVGLRFADVRVYAIISTFDGSRSAKSIRDTARAALAGGAGAIQLRQKEICDDIMLAMAAELRELTDETNRLFIVNDRPDIAAIVGADGVHLGQRDLPVGDARRLLRPGAIVGKSTHSAAQATAAVNEGADYVAIGPVFETGTKDAGEPVGVEMVRQVVEKITLPVVAIGGINASNAADVIAAGAKCLAVSSAICTADNPKAATAELRQLFGD